MAIIPLGISLATESGGFVLRRKTDDRRTITIRLSAEELLGLKGTIDLWSSRILSQRQAGSEQVQPIVAHAVSRVRVQPEALNERVLLMVGVAAGEQMTFALPPAAVEHLAVQIPLVLSEMRATYPTKPS